MIEFSRPLFDTTFLSFLLVEDIGPIHDETGREIADAKLRVEQLIGDLNSSSAKLLIPTPVLAEVLTKCEESIDSLIQRIKTPHFKILDFDLRAAIELAFINRKDSRDKQDAGIRQKVKIDRQIVAIARVNNADVIYTTDRQMRSLADALGILHKGLEDLPPPSPQQEEISFED